MTAKDVSWQRSIGLVTKIRLSPRDVMSCIDAVNAVKGEMEGMSLSATVKRGIAIALETLRGAAVLPEHDGFEYTQMIAPYTQISRVSKIKVGHALVIQDQQVEQFDLPRSALPTRPVLSHTDMSSVVVTEEDLAKARKRERILRQYKELVFKRDADPRNWSKKEQAALVKLEKEMTS